MRTHGIRREGFALALALVAIVIIGSLIAGAFFASTQEFRIGRNTLIEQRAFHVAEYGLNEQIAKWPTSWNLPAPPKTGAVAGSNYGKPIGYDDSISIRVAYGDSAKVKVTRLTDNTFLVVSEGRASIGSAQAQSFRRTSMFVRLAYPDIKVGGAITTAGNLNISGSANIDGRNTVPSKWDAECAGVGGNDTAAVSASPTAVITYQKKNIASPVEVIRDAAAADSNTYIRYGSENWNTLVANADITLNGDVGPMPVGTATTCDNAIGSVNHLTNWGEPSRVGGFIEGCKSYFPIIYSPTDLHLNGGRGQGILLVNGDLRIDGNIDFYGLIIVRDDIDKGNGNANIYGGVMARNAVIGDPSVVNGNQSVYYSKCAIDLALRGSAALTPVIRRSWAQLY